MFEGITEGLTNAFSAFRGSGKITEGNIRDGMKQVRTALLEADVAFDVAQDFVRNITEQAIGEDVLKSLRPDQQLVGIVHQGLIDLMAGDHTLPLKRDGVTVLMMCGLQGSGKTTTCGKLAPWVSACVCPSRTTSPRSIAVPPSSSWVRRLKA